MVRTDEIAWYAGAGLEEFQGDLGLRQIQFIRWCKTGFDFLMCSSRGGGIIL